MAWTVIAYLLVAIAGDVGTVYSSAIVGPRGRDRVELERDRDVGWLAAYSTLSSLRNREIETETLIFAPISLSYIEID